MKRILLSLLTLCILLCGCTAPEAPTATPDSAAATCAPTEKPTSAKPKKPKKTEKPAPTSEQLAEQRYNEILASSLRSDSASLSVEPIDQYPELPTGCEVVALTMALNVFGCGLDKVDVAENYLEYSDSFVLGFCGSPFEDDGAGVMPPGVIQTVANYAQATGKPIYAFNTSKLPLSELYRFIEAGCPAVVWTTYYMDEPMTTDDGEEYDGEYYMWYDNEHCVTLYGYDRSEGVVEIADPLQGAVTVDAAEFERINREIGGWSVVLIDASTLNQSATKPATEKPTEKSSAKAKKK